MWAFPEFHTRCPDSDDFGYRKIYIQNKRNMSKGHLLVWKINSQIFSWVSRAKPLMLCYLSKLFQLVILVHLFRSYFTLGTVIKNGRARCGTCVHWKLCTVDYQIQLPKWKWQEYLKVGLSYGEDSLQFFGSLCAMGQFMAAKAGVSLRRERTASRTWGQKYWYHKKYEVIGMKCILLKKSERSSLAEKLPSFLVLLHHFNIWPVASKGTTCRVRIHAELLVSESVGLCCWSAAAAESSSVRLLCTSLQSSFFASSSFPAVWLLWTSSESFSFSKSVVLLLARLASDIRGEGHECLLLFQGQLNFSPASSWGSLKKLLNKPIGQQRKPNLYPNGWEQISEWCRKKSRKELGQVAECEWQKGGRAGGYLCWASS